MGRPVKYETPEEMQSDIDAYFDSCSEDEPPRVSALAYALDMTTETLRAYGNEEKFSATVKRAKQRIEMHLEKNLNNPSCTGTIFNLKNNFGWKDKQETELSGKLETTTKVLQLAGVDSEHPDSK